MRVEYVPPSEFDAEVESGRDKRMNMRPKFYTKTGPGVLGMMICTDDQERVLDRVLIQVSGNGNLSVTHRKDEVKPLAEQNTEEDDNGSGNDTAYRDSSD